MSRRARRRASLSILAAALLLLLSGRGAGARQRGEEQPAAPPSYELQGTLADIKSKYRVLFVVTRSRTVDSRDTTRTVIEEARKAGTPDRRRYVYTYNTIAKKLNGYIKKHGGMSSVAQLAEAEFVLIFNLLEYRKSLNGYYPFGEFYVVTNHEPPRLIWKSSKVAWAEDAAKEFIRELKASRGQK